MTSKQDILEAACEVGARNTKQVTNHLMKAKKQSGYAPNDLKLIRRGLAQTVGQVLRSMSLNDMQHMEALNPTMFDASTAEIYVKPVFLKNKHNLPEDQNWYIPSLGEYRHSMELIIEGNHVDEAIQTNQERMDADQRSHDLFVKSARKYRKQ